MVGEEGVVFVGEDRLELDRPGRRIDLVVDRRERSGGETRLEVAVEGLDRKPPLHGQGFLDADDLVLGDREGHGDGVDLGDDGDAGRIACANEVAGVDQPEADPAADRRFDAAVVELKLDVVDQRSVDLHRRLGLPNEGPLAVDLLLGHLPQIGERLGALEIEFHGAEGRGVAGQLCLGLPQLHLVEPLIDLGQQVSGRDHLPFGKRDLHQFPVDPTANRDGIERRHRSQTVQMELHVPLPGLDGRHRHDPRRRRFGSPGLRLDERSPLLEERRVVPDGAGEPSPEEQPHAPCQPAPAPRQGGGGGQV